MYTIATTCYGNQFARASAEAIRRATHVLGRPTRSNLIAIAAPGGGSGNDVRAGAADLGTVVDGAATVAEVLARIDDLDYEWGVSDGN